MIVKYRGESSFQSIPSRPARTTMLYTVMGSASWNTLLTAPEYFLCLQKELLNRYSDKLWQIMAIPGAGFVFYPVYKFRKKGYWLKRKDFIGF